MKKSLTIVLGLLACLSFGQKLTPSAFFRSVKQEASINVRKHEMGAELVEITFQGTNYPESAIIEKVNRLGEELGDAPRGTQASAVDGRFAKVTFAINGLISTKSPRFNLAALARAMAFGDHPIRSFSVFFEGLDPDRNTPARWFADNDAWMLEGMGMAVPRGIDYRIKVNTNNPKDIFMPGNQPLSSEKDKKVSGNGSKIFIFGGIIVGAIAIGLLVYSALLRPRSNAR